MNDIAGKLEMGLKDILDEQIIMIETEPEKTLDVILNSLKILTSNGLQGIVLTSSRPYSKLIEMCGKKDINTEQLFFIDTIMQSVGIPLGNEGDGKSVTLVSSTSALTEISIALDNACSNLGGNGFLFIDSLTTLLIHNNPTTLARFIHFTLTRLRVRNMGAILTTLSGEMDRKVRAEIVTLCDKTITV